jgi:hypothetical protein
MLAALQGGAAEKPNSQAAAAAALTTIDLHPKTDCQ